MGFKLCIHRRLSQRLQNFISVHKNLHERISNILHVFYVNFNDPK